MPGPCPSVPVIWVNTSLLLITAPQKWVKGGGNFHSLQSGLQSLGDTLWLTPKYTSRNAGLLLVKSTVVKAASNGSCKYIDALKLQQLPEISPPKALWIMIENALGKA